MAAIQVAGHVGLLASKGSCSALPDSDGLRNVSSRRVQASSWRTDGLIGLRADREEPSTWPVSRQILCQAGSGSSGGLSESAGGIQNPLEIIELIKAQQAARAREAAGEAVEEAEEEEVIEEEPRKRFPPPKKLSGEERAVAPWGWEGTSLQGEGAGLGKGKGSLEGWLVSKGLPKQKVELRGVKEGGRGLVALENLGKGEALLYVPESLIMTADKVYNSPNIGPILKANNVPEWPALAVFLLAEAAKRDKSNWSTYIDTLPSAPPCILQWSVDEVDVLLQGSPMQKKAIECIADVSSTFSSLDSQVFSKNRDVFPEKDFTLGLFKWAFAVLFSRLVRLPSQGGKLALVPWADMLNHRCEVEAYLDFDEQKKAVVLKTDRSYDAGKEVYASYGPRSNGSLLLAYGVLPTTRNPQDAVEVTLGLDPDDPLLKQKQQALAKHGLSTPLQFPLRMEGWPSQLVDFARLVAVADGESASALDGLAASVAAAEAKGSFLPANPLTSGGSKWPLDLEIRAREVILAACQVALSSYKTTLAEDEAALAGVLDDYLEDDGEQRVRVLAAAALRASERRILFRADFVLRMELRELRAEAGARAGRPRVELGNNLGGERASNQGIIGKILSRIVRP